LAAIAVNKTVDKRQCVEHEKQ